MYSDWRTVTPNVELWGERSESHTNAKLGNATKRAGRQASGNGET